MNKIVEILMWRDGLERGEAENCLREGVQRLYEGDHPEEILREEYGLEPDYIFDLIGEMTFLKRQGN